MRAGCQGPVGPRQHLAQREEDLLRVPDGDRFTEPGHTLYIADFDAQQRTITNPKAIANEEGKPFWFAYPRWIDGEAAVIYHSDETGQGPALRVPLGRRLDQARVHEPGSRLPVSAWRSGAVLKKGADRMKTKELSAGANS